MLLRAESVWNEGRKVHLSEVVSPCLAKISEEVCKPEATIGEKLSPASKPAATEAAVAGGATDAHRANLCACGSGLRSLRCCELDPAFAAAPEAMERIAILGNLALKAVANGDFVAAEARTLEVLDIAPHFSAGLWILYLVRRRAGQEHAALVVLRRLVAVAPNHVEAAQELALLLFQRGDLVGAEHHARNAIRLAPVHLQSHKLMGMILTESQRPQVGEFHYRRALEISGERDPILLANLAWNLKCQGKIIEARALYRESVETAPNIFQTLFGWGQLEEVDGDLVAAKSKLDRAAEIRPEDPGLRVARSTLLVREGEAAAALAELERAAADPNALLAKGRILESLGRYDEAFGCFDGAKRLARELTGKSYFAPQAQDMTDRLRQFFVGERVRLLPKASVREGSAQPIFIIGFPRSGTTLAEQALSSHPRISAGDELPFVNDLTDTIPQLFGSPLSYPEALAELWMGDNRRGPEALRDMYLQRAELWGFIKSGSTWFTDKMPLNEMHLGLISLIFPRSPLIHIVRHPLDVVVSVYSHHLTHGYFCAYALETIAQHYALVMDLVRHYRSEMALRYLPIRYEDMVADMSGSVRRMLDFIGEGFDERCVNFHDNPRLPQTPSYAQVKRKLYQQSRFRYRHYRKHLEPVIPILKPVIDRLGYVLD
jgi:tetratricopeptide (TPR) repeat protein